MGQFWNFRLHGSAARDIALRMALPELHALSRLYIPNSLDRNIYCIVSLLRLRGLDFIQIFYWHGYVFVATSEDLDKYKRILWTLRKSKLNCVLSWLASFFHIIKCSTNTPAWYRIVSVSKMSYYRIIGPILCVVF